MTINEAITNCNLISPNNILKSQKVAWLSHLDGLIKSEILDNFERNDTEIDLSNFNGYDSDTDDNTELLIPFPYDEIYVNYLIAQVHLAYDENTKYNNYAAIYNEQKDTFERFYIRTHKQKARRNITCF